MPRILYLTDSLMAGGTEQQLVELLSRLDRQRFEPSVICLYGNRVGRSLHFLASLRQLDIPVTLLDLNWSALDKLVGLIGIIRAIRYIRPDIVQAVNYHSNLLVRLTRPFLPSSTALVGCIYVEYTAKQLFYERLSSRLCQAVVCNSPSVEAQLASIVPEAHLHQIPNGIDLRRFAYNPDPLLRSRLAPQARRILLFVGRVTKQKSPHLMVEALGLLKQRQQLSEQTAVWIVGEAEFPQPLESAIERFNLGDIVSCFPATMQPEAFYHAADITVLPSLWEGLPNVMLESWAAGRPVAASEAANSADVIQPGINGWTFPTGDVPQLAEVLRKVLLLSDADLQRMNAVCQQSAADFSVERMVQRYEALYDSLLIARS